MLVNNSKGFLLAEISIAVFLVIMLLAVMGLILQTYKFSQIAAGSTEVTCIAQAKLEQLKAGMMMAAGQEITTLNTINYSITWDKSLINEVGGQRLYKAVATVTWVECGKNRSVRFSTYLLEGNNHLVKPQW